MGALVGHPAQDPTHHDNNSKGNEAELEQRVDVLGMGRVDASK